MGGGLALSERGRGRSEASRRFVSPSSPDGVDGHAPEMATESEDRTMQSSHLEARQSTGQTELLLVSVESGRRMSGPT